MAEVFWIVFLIFTIAHPIGDFLVGNRRKWKGEFWLVLNPLHWIYDLSPLRQHGKYSAIKELPVIAVLPKDEPNNPFKKDYFYIPDQDATYVSQFVQQPFWFWLGVDQLAHVFLNIVMAWFIDVLI